MRLSMWMPVSLALMVSASASAQTTYTFGRDTLRFREVSTAEIHLTTPQGELPMKSDHAATVAVIRQASDTVRAWYEALDIGVSSPMGEQRPATTEALKAPFTLSMNPRGRVRLIAAPTFPTSFKGVTDLTYQFDDFFMRLPAKPLAIGLAWTDTSAFRDSTAEKASNRQAIVRYRVERDTVVNGIPALVISMKQQLTLRTTGVDAQGGRIQSALDGTDDGIVVFAPKAGRLLGRKRTGQLAGQLTMNGPVGEIAMKQSYTYTNTLDAVK
jgi:hypothetical protein